MTSNPAIPDTRLRLLKAAGEVFAEHGYRQATVRDIVDRAGANIAAVNYHFRDKLGLYRATLDHWVSASMEKHPPDGGLGPDAPAARRLEAFVRGFLFRLLDSGVPAWHGRLMAREMADPTQGIIETLVERHFQPHARLLFGILRDLLGPGASEEHIRLCSFSVVGQCLFYRHCEAAIHLIAPAQQFSPQAVDRIAEHVTRFTLAGIESSPLDLKSQQKRKRAKFKAAERS